MVTKLFLFAGIVCLLLPFLAGGIESDSRLLMFVGVILLCTAGVTHAISKRRAD